MSCVKIKFRRLSLILLLLFLTTYVILGQEIDLQFRHLGSEQGLSGSSVNVVGQDNNGYLWFGTDNGLNKYDGYTLKSYFNDINDSTTTGSDIIFKVFKVNNQETWFLTSEDLISYDRKKDAFKRIEHLPTNFSRGNIIKIFNGSIYVLKEGTILKYNSQKGKMEKCDENGFHSNVNEILNFHISKNNTYWSILKNEKIEANSFNGIQQFKAGKIQCISEDENGNIYFGGRGVYYFYDNTGKKFSKISFPKEFGTVDLIWDIYCTHDFIWFGTEKAGLIGLDLKTGKYHTFLHNEIENSKSIKSVYVDRQNNIWVGCWKSGVYVANLNSSRSFKNIHKIMGAKNRLSGEIVTSIYEYNDLLFIALDHSGLNVLNRKTGEMSYFFHQPDNKNSLPSYSPISIAKGENDIYYIGCWGGFTVFNYSTKTFKNFYHQPNNSNSLCHNDIKHVLRTSNNKIYISTSGGGISIFDPITEQFTQIKNKTKNKIKYCLSAFQDTKGNIWAGSLEGLFKITANGVAIKCYQADNKKGSISNNWVQAIIEDNQGFLWVATNYGLNKFDPEKEVFEVYTKDDGLPSNSIYGILFDNSENLWISTNQGISKLSPKTKTIRNFDFIDGLQDNEFNGNAYFKNSRGEIFFGGINGVTYFHPDSIKKNDFIPPVYLTDFKINYKDVEIGVEGSPLTNHISETKSIILTYKQSTFSIGYVALNYVNSDKNNYAFMLEGLDEDWNYVNNRREALYTNLDAGDYVFKVIASNNDGLWNKNGIYLKIKILPPWWASWWFRSIMVVLIGAMIFVFFRWRINNVKKRSFDLEMIVKDRTYELIELNEVLNRNNNLLREKQRQIEKQSDELEIQKEELLRQQDDLLNINDKLNKNNELLLDKQTRIEEQSEELRAQRNRLQEINEALNKSNATKDKLFSIIAHDLRSPFNVLLGFSELLIDNFDSWNKEEQKKYVKHIYNSAQNVYNLLENLLLWARMQHQTIKLRPTRFSLKEAIIQSIETLKENAKQKSVFINVNVPQNVSIFADENMIRTVLHNLINNAIKFSFEYNPIDIGYEIINGNCIVSIKDNGVGISEESKVDIFSDNVFSTNGTMDEKGTGLGLILCKEFVEAHKGKIWFESEKGTTFYFTLPVDAALLK